MADLSAFLPWSFNDLAAKALAGGERYRVAAGTILFTDVAGFTPLTEALSVLGREGAEELTRVLNGYFDRMIAILEEEGGDVLRFGGDAMTVFFPGAGAAPALRAAARMMEAMGAFARVPTRAGEFSLSMKVGAAWGPVLLAIVGDEESGFDFYALGPPLDAAAAAEHQARPGEIVLDRSIPGRPPRGLSVRPAAGRRLLSGIPDTPPRRPGHPPPPPEEVLRRLVPEVIQPFADPSLLGEHRGTAVLFVGFQGAPFGAVERGEQEGLEALHRSLDELYRLFGEAARLHGGYLNKLDMGDKGAKALFLFGSPLALENKEEMALRAALHLLNPSRLPHGVALHIGLTSAPLFAGPLGSAHCREYTAMGNGINLAARLMQQAGPGQIRCDEATARTVRAFDFRALSPVRLKGMKEPVPVFEPAGEREETLLEGGRLLERGEIQKGLLRHLLTGEGPPLLLRADAGLGKTALLEWVLALLKEKGRPCVRVPLGPHSRGKAYAAWRGPLRAALGIRQGSAPEEIEAALAPALPPTLRPFAPLLHPLLDLPPRETAAVQPLGPSERKELTAALLKSLFERCRGWALLLDNLHFADPLSRDLLTSLCGVGPDSLFRVAASLRPGFPEAEKALPGADVLELSPLSEKGILKLLTDLHGMIPPEKPVVRWFASRSQGNPAVVGALLTALEAEGLVQRGDYGARIDGDRLFKTHFPDTLEGLYLAPVDLLRPEEKKLLQQASVLGVSVSVNLLREAAGLDASKLEGLLGALQRSRLLLPDTWGERPYVRFADAMLRDAVYEAAPFEVKREIHARLARTLEAEGHSSPKLWPVLARHFRAAGEEAEARRYDRLAGRDAYERADNVSAVSHFLEWARNFSGEPAEIEDAFSALEVFKDLGQWPAYSHLLERFSRPGLSLPPLHRARLLSHQARFHARKWDLDGAEALLRESARIGRAANDPSTQARALLNLVGLVYGPGGQLATAEKLLKKTLSLRLPASDRPYIAVGWMNLGLVLKHRGRLRDALHSLERAYRSLPEGRAAYIRVVLALNLCSLSYEMGRFTEALRWGRKGLSIAERFALRQYLPHAHLEMANGLLSRGGLRSAQLHIERALALARFSKEKGLEARCLQLLQRVLFAQGKLEQAYESVVKALRLFMEEEDGRSLRLALLDLATFFSSLNDREGLARLLAAEGVSSALDRLPGDPHSEAVSTFALNLAAGCEPKRLLRHVSKFERAWRTDRLEGYLLCAEAAMNAGNPTVAVAAARAARRAWLSFPDWFYRVRMAALHCSIKDRWRIPPMMEPSIRRHLGGPWGLRLLCEASLRSADVSRRTSLRKAAMRHLRLMQQSSLPWQWEALLRHGGLTGFQRGVMAASSKTVR